MQRTVRSVKRLSVKVRPVTSVWKSEVPVGGRILEYNPELDGEADPGEVVWTWVAYEDLPDQGKDRPVLVAGRQGRTLLGLMLSSNEEREGDRHWFALGPGAWDRQERPSWVRLDRVLVVDEDGIRREGCILDPHRFAEVAAVLKNRYGWLT
ncbi:type II toxin-antitoxin system PemK/MazF family toxin [Micromonospora sp. CPCC 205371]|nr:type II toxin-antitoxin system PemK/MazF family toxin [Micromonospora sp. CPCC 205371]